MNITAQKPGGLTVLALGRWIISGDTKPFQMCIWIAQPASDTGIRVTIDPTQTPTGNFGFATLTTPFTMNPSTTYIIGFQPPSTTGDPWCNVNSTLTQTADAVLNWATDYDNGAWISQASGQSYGPVNFKYT
jgi:hypothetical protein